MLPFTVEQFLGVFHDYNLAIWPMQVVTYGLAFAALAMAITKKGYNGRSISAILAFFWLWNGAQYHLTYFAEINKAAYLFGALFLVQGVIIFLYGVVKNRLSFGPGLDPQKIVAMVMIFYAAIIYPLIGYLLNHGYPNSPLLGVAPCPTTIFTFGMFLLANNRVPFTLCLIPLLWSLIGFNAALALGIKEDMGLLAAGLIGTAMIIYRNKRAAREGLGNTAVEGTV